MASGRALSQITRRLQTGLWSQTNSLSDFHVATKSNAPEIFYAFISSFETGVNGGIEPLLLPLNQLASGVNTSVRGAYVTHRPPLQIQNLSYADPALQAIVEMGLFQGGGYYRPDYGSESLIAQISGYLILFTEAGSTWNVTDISVPGDLNNATVPQVWMWQAEKWMIIQDGTGKLPIFFDGTTSRRSYGPASQYAITSAPFTPPIIGAQVQLTLATAYTGPFNVPILLNGEFYQAIDTNPAPPTPGAPTTYQAILTNINDTPGATVPTNTDIIIQNGGSGTLGAGVSYLSVPIGQPIAGTRTISISVTPSSFAGLKVGDQIMGVVTVSPQNIGSAYGGKIVSTPTISAINLAVNTITLSFDVTYFAVAWDQYNPYTIQCSIAAGTVFQTSNYSITPIGTTVGSFVVPAAGSPVTIGINQPYTGANGQQVVLAGKLYSISKVPAVIPGVPPVVFNLTVLNLTDASGEGQYPASVLAGAIIISVPELPAGRMGAYGMGRNALSLTDGISFMYGDIVNGAAGTPAYNYRDSVLKTTEDTFQGGAFRLPGTGDIITAMVFSANLDVSLGQGPLQVGTARSIFTCTVEFDRTLWPSTKNPILTQALIGKGPLGQNSTIVANSDTLFRSVEGLASLILARRDFDSWGNVPISQEMKRIFEKDYQSLLSYGSAVTFDNRFLVTVAPNILGQGVFHVGLVAMNFDAVSNLRTKLPPVYDGVWKGINVLQVISGIVNGTRRAFAFSLNLTAKKIELYEFLPESTAQTQDNGNAPIVWTFETPILFNQATKPLTELVKLRDGEIYLRDIVGTVNIEVQYRPDFYPCWTTWRKFTVCADPDTSVADSQPGYRTRIGLGEPDSTPCEAANNRPMRTGYFFQCRVVITGSCKWMGMRASAVVEPQPAFALPICDEVCP
jgi:hypothetical protein